jgi:hypothetical protein
LFFHFFFPFSPAPFVANAPYLFHVLTGLYGRTPHAAFALIQSIFRVSCEGWDRHPATYPMRMAKSHRPPVYQLPRHPIPVK